MALQEAVDSYKKSHTSGVWKAHDASYFNPYDQYDFVCSECGSEGDSYFEFCPSCGTRMYPPGTQKKHFTEDDV